MKIPKLINTRYFSRMSHYYPVKGNTDRLVFVVKQTPSTFKYVVFDLSGNLTLHDKILAYIGSTGVFKLPAGEVYGPFYVGNLDDTTVDFPEWDSTAEFIELLEYEFLRRKLHSAKVDNDGLVDEIEGRALDWAEFKHLYVHECRLRDLIYPM